jgi:fatty acid desaturase
VGSDTDLELASVTRRYRARAEMFGAAGGLVAALILSWWCTSRWPDAGWLIWPLGAAAILLAWVGVALAKLCMSGLPQPQWPSDSEHRN